MKNMMLLADFYKISHKNFYPEGLTKLYSTWTPRSNKYFQESDCVVWFGLQGFIQKYLIKYFDKHFFERDIEEIICEYETIIHNTYDEDTTSDHIRALHKLGYLPIKICALPEGTKVPYGVPCCTVENTHPDFAWVTNYLETLFSCNLWITSTTATTAYLARQIIEEYCDKTSDIKDTWKSVGAGDFSFRGMASLEAAITSGAAFLTSFSKTSTIPSIEYLNKYYCSGINNKIGSWSASVEHSCTTSNFAVDGNEKDYFLRMVNDYCKDKPFSFVADSYDYFGFFDIIEECKEDILNHKGCIRIRPDSGDPEKIICGNPNATDERERLGSLNLLWKIFGGTVNSKGYKVLNPHIGLVYGDSITLERCRNICEHMMQLGFAVENVVFGFGSYSMQYKSRDTQGWAYKVTYAEVNGKPIMVYKDPKTSDGLKKSQRGMCVVYHDIEHYYVTGKDKITYSDGYTSENIENCAELSDGMIGHNLLEPIFENGRLIKITLLKEIRNRIHKEKGGF